MRIRAIPQLVRNMRRWTEIFSVLSRYGLADWISRRNIRLGKDRLKDREGQALTSHTTEKRIRLALTDLGPTFIKLGQLLSTRPDVVGAKLAEELAFLQEHTPADPPEVVRATFATELGVDVATCFSEFDEHPIASASIGQVHRARLKTGEAVVVKIQHAGIEETVGEDLEVLAGLALLAERVPELASYRPSQTIAEMGRILRRELDFERELRNLQQFHERFQDDPTIRIPLPYAELSTSRVLTMERFEGIKLADRERLLAAGLDLDAIARRGARLYLDMIFWEGFYHADPHPGNIVILPGNAIGLLDFGMVGRVEEQLRESIEGMLLAITQQDTPMLKALVKRVGDTPPDLDERALASELSEFVGDFANQSLDRFDLSGALRSMTDIMHRFRIMLPPQAGMLLKTLITLEGTGRKVSPTLSLLDLLQPLHRRIMLQRISPRRQWRRLLRYFFEVEHLLEILPERMTDILDQVQAGKFDVHLDHRGLEPSVNRLVLGLLTSALFLGSAVLISSEVPPLLFPEHSYWGFHRLSLLGLAACGVSLVLGLRVLRAIYKSGHLDRHE